jgi:transcription initiation factor TFIID subunit 3
LTFRELGINVSELEEYIQYVDPVVPAIECPKFPVKKESHLNFLKPGSKEVLTRPMHMHEHLPPVNPPEDGKNPPIL